MHLAEQPLDAAAHRVRIVDVDVVVLRVRRLLDKGLVDADAAELDGVLGLDEARGVVRGEVREARGGVGFALAFAAAGGLGAPAAAPAAALLPRVGRRGRSGGVRLLLPSSSSPPSDTSSAELAAGLGKLESTASSGPEGDCGKPSRSMTT